MELLGLIEDYRQGLVPLIVPLTLLKHHLNRSGARVGAPAGLSASVPEGADAAESRLIQSFVSLAVGASTALEGANRVASPGIK